MSNGATAAPNNTPEAQPLAISGSWEDLYNQAVSLATNHNDEAIPIFRKIVERLPKIPESRRLAANNRLQNIYMQATRNFHAYLTMREHYEESLAVLATIRNEVDEEAAKSWDLHEADVLLQSGDVEAALGKVRAIADTPDGEIPDWGHLVTLYMRVGRVAEVDPILEKMMALLEEKWADDEQGEEASHMRAYVAGTQAIVAMEREEWDKGIDLFEKAADYSENYARSTNLIYMRLIRQGEYERALPFLERDQEVSPMRAGFWSGLARLHTASKEEAESLWQDVTKLSAEESEEPALFEQILAYYYLGDEAGEGLGIILEALREQRNHSWHLFFLAALGWIVRGNRDNARQNLEIATAQRRSSGEGLLLPVDTWYLAQGLMSEEDKEALSSFFETTSPNAPVQVAVVEPEVAVYPAPSG